MPKVGENRYCGERYFVFVIKIGSELMAVEESHVESDNFSRSFLQLFQNIQAIAHRHTVWKTEEAENYFSSTLQGE